MQDRINSRLAFKILFTLYTGRTIHEHEVAEEVRRTFNEHVLKTTINKTVRFADSASSSQPMVFFDPGNKGSDAYRQALKEILYGKIET